VEAHLVEQHASEPGPLDGLQVLLGDDHVGVDVHHRQRCGHSGVRGELLHVASPTERAD
jgi:hypothetical protein